MTTVKAIWTIVPCISIIPWTAVRTGRMIRTMQRIPHLLRADLPAPAVPHARAAAAEVPTEYVPALSAMAYHT